MADGTPTAELDIKDIRSRAEVKTKEIRHSLTKPEIEEKFKFLSSPPSADNYLQKNQIADELLSDQENPNAHLAVLTYLLSGSPEVPGSLEDLNKVNFSILKNQIGLNDEQVQELETKLRQFPEELKTIDEHRQEYEWSRRIDLSGNKELLKDALRKEIGLCVDVHRALLPIREGLLLNTDIPDDYKIEIVTGLSMPLLFNVNDENEQQALEHDQQIDKVLSTLYKDSATPVDLRRAIADTATRRLIYDPYALAIIPPEEFDQLNLTDDIFLASMSNKYTTSEYVENTLASLFFPNENPQKVRDAWQALFKKSSNRFYETPVFIKIIDKKFGITNKEIFQEFLDNSEKLIPLIDLLSSYGFTYSVIRQHESRAIDYVPRLLELARDIPTLQKELVDIKSMYPDFQYTLTPSKEYDAVSKEFKNSFDDNPYALAFQQFANTGGWAYNVTSLKQMSPEHKFQEGMKILQMVPERWRDSYVRSFAKWTYINIFNDDVNPNSQTAIARQMNTFITRLISIDTMRIIGTEYFYNSLDPKTQNARFAYSLLLGRQNQIRPRNEREGVSNDDCLWFDFVQKVGDLYRYDLSSGDIEEKKKMARDDLDIAYKATQRIVDPQTRDTAYEHLVYAYTDADYKDLQRAEEIVSKMNNPAIAQNAREEIELEKEREEKGLTTSWKKIEKVKRHSNENAQLLIDLLGFSTKEGMEQAKHVYYTKSPLEHTSVRAKQVEPSEQNSQALRNEVERIQEQVGISTNLSWESVKLFLRTGRIVSIWENLEELEKRNKTRSYHYGRRRDEVERMLGNRAKGGASDPHPIYAALWSPNGRDEFFGAAFPYGECFVKMKNQRVEGRTSLTFDDSFNGFRDFPTTYEHGPTLKAMMNLIDNETMHGYVEAQILEGATIEDVESVNIPKLVLQEIQKKHGTVGVQRALDEINELRKQHPGIQINIIQEASASKIVELLSSYYLGPAAYRTSMEEYYKELAKYEV